MAIDPTAAASSAGASGTGRTRLADSYETFMNLLTAQIKNQDPLSPMDSTQFTQQLVQMTGVEQQLLTNDLLEKLVTNTGSGIQTSVSLLGREVRAVHNEAKLTAGKADWSYKLDREATEVTIEVVNSLGKVVQVEKTSGDDLKAGDHTYSWNGKDRTGAQLPNGETYTLRITAKDSAGAAVGVTNFLKGVVTGVEQSDGKTFITVNGVQIGWEKVTSIADVPKTASTDTTPDPDKQDDDTSSQQAV
ncbi:MAG: flagellar biosynthesis protein FlgD [Phenylobacterium sp.]|uniref:flagellar hook assembly protein FlgD n=1 Tax=Phenylobacterium sp. TaxID=1871053 RepID=UPI0025E0DCA9|nr:flagellar hook assembly protein FlgD [Phenylobacterium sp.]MBA4010355.1 flagellar biosynthesis protein FlgD [Phenylobacterium sp.]